MFEWMRKWFDEDGSPRPLPIDEDDVCPWCGEARRMHPNMPEPYPDGVNPDECL